MVVTLNRNLENELVNDIGWKFQQDLEKKAKESLLDLKKKGKFSDQELHQLYKTNFKQLLKINVNDASVLVKKSSEIDNVTKKLLAINLKNGKESGVVNKIKGIIYRPLGIDHDLKKNDKKRNIMKGVIDEVMGLPEMLESIIASPMEFLSWLKNIFSWETWKQMLADMANIGMSTPEQQYQSGKTAAMVLMMIFPWWIAKIAAKILKKTKWFIKKNFSKWGKWIVKEADGKWVKWQKNQGKEKQTTNKNNKSTTNKNNKEIVWGKLEKIKGFKKWLLDKWKNIKSLNSPLANLKGLLKGISRRRKLKKEYKQLNKFLNEKQADGLTRLEKAKRNPNFMRAKQRLQQEKKMLSLKDAISRRDDILNLRILTELTRIGIITSEFNRMGVDDEFFETLAEYLNEDNQETIAFDKQQTNIQIGKIDVGDIDTTDLDAMSAEQLKTATITITGLASKTGLLVFNQKLATQRAQNAKAKLMAKYPSLNPNNIKLLYHVQPAESTDDVYDRQGVKIDVTAKDMTYVKRYDNIKSQYGATDSV